MFQFGMKIQPLQTGHVSVDIFTHCIFKLTLTFRGIDFRFNFQSPPIPNEMRIKRLLKNISIYFVGELEKSGLAFRNFLTKNDVFRK